MDLRLLDTVEINKDEKHETCDFGGWVKLFGHLFYVEGDSFTIVSHVERDEYGNKMHEETETEIAVNEIYSGVDCEVEYNSAHLQTALEYKLLN